MSVPVESPSSTSVRAKMVTTAKVVLPAESLFGGTEVRDKVVTATEAVRLIRDGDSVVVEGFVGQCFAEELTLALEQRFLLTGTPQHLNLVFTVAPGDRQGRGLDRLAHDGLLKRAVGGHWGCHRRWEKWRWTTRSRPTTSRRAASRTSTGTSPRASRACPGSGWGPSSTRGTAAGRSTHGPQRIWSSCSRSHGQEWLLYRAFPIDVVFLRGTTADPHGNVTMEREALTLDNLAMAMAAKNSGGVVIVQVERLAQAGCLPRPEVKIPGALVDCVAVARSRSTTRRPTPPPTTRPSPGSSAGPLETPPAAWARRPEGHRPARRDASSSRARLINLGIGMPEAVAGVAPGGGPAPAVTLTAEPGVIGGLPASGLNFGAAVNNEATGSTRTSSSTSTTAAGSTRRTSAWPRWTRWGTST